MFYVLRWHTFVFFLLFSMFSLVSPPVSVQVCVFFVFAVDAAHLAHLPFCDYNIQLISSTPALFPLIVRLPVRWRPVPFLQPHHLAPCKTTLVPYHGKQSSHLPDFAIPKAHSLYAPLHCPNPRPSSLFNQFPPNPLLILSAVGSTKQNNDLQDMDSADTESFCQALATQDALVGQMTVLFTK